MQNATVELGHRFHRSVMRRWMPAFVLVGCIGSVMVERQAQAQTSLSMAVFETQEEDVVTALYACFRQGIEASMAEAKVEFGPSSDIFFSEQLARATQVLGDAPRLAWCRPWFVEPYLRARHALAGLSARKAGHSHHHTLATSLATDAEGQLVVLASEDTGGSHALDHAKMTQEALWGRHVGQRLKALAVGRQSQTLLVQAAQVPDLYQFTEALPHAREKEAATDGVVNDSGADFVDYITRLVTEARADLRAGRTTYGLVRLGMAAHGVQDLMVYRGLSLSEQAALSFSAGPLAEVGPAMPIDAERWDQAVGASRQLLAVALSPGDLQPMAHETAISDHPLSAVMEEMGLEQQAVDFAQLRQYWRLGWQGRQAFGAERPPQEAPRAAGRWDAESLLAAIVAALSAP